MTARVLGVGDLRAIVAARGLDQLLDELIVRLGETLGASGDEALQTDVRRGFAYEKPGPGLLEWMPAMELGRVAALKTVGYHPGNPTQRRLPTVLATTTLVDTASGAVLAIVDASFLTALRTGAASALATDVLSPRGPITLGVVGCGAQAVAQVHAISRLRRIEQVLAHDVDADVAATLAGRLAFVDVPVEVVAPAALPRLLAEVDVLCTCTTVEVGAGPVIDDGEHRPWLHVNAVGSDFPGKTELPASLVRRALVCPDLLEQCLVEGECQHLDGDRPAVDLAALLRTPALYEPAAAGLTVFDSTGWALEDLVAAELFLDHARELDIGREVALQPTTTDPYDPYAPVR